MIGRCNESRHRSLAKGDHVQARTKNAHGFDEVCDVLLQGEATLIDGHVAGVDPIGDEDLERGQQAQDDLPQENGKVAREWSNDEDFR